MLKKADNDQSSQGFKVAARRFASGVTIVTTSIDEDVYGVTVSSFSSLSLSPLLVSVSINNYSPLIARVELSRHFAISILRHDQQAISRYFATPNRDETDQMLPGIKTFKAVTGSPVIEDSLSYFDCTLYAILPGGDHSILVGHVQAANATEGEPLLYYDGNYHSIARKR